MQILQPRQGLQAATGRWTRARRRRTCHPASPGGCRGRSSPLSTGSAPSSGARFHRMEKSINTSPHPRRNCLIFGAPPCLVLVAICALFVIFWGAGALPKFLVQLLELSGASILDSGGNLCTLRAIRGERKAELLWSRRPAHPSRSVAASVAAMAALLRERNVRAFLLRSGGVQLLAPILRSAVLPHITPVSRDSCWLSVHLRSCPDVSPVLQEKHSKISRALTDTRWQAACACQLRLVPVCYGEFLARLTHRYHASL